MLISDWSSDVCSSDRVFLSANGFDGPALLARTQEPAIKAKLAANTEAAVARGVFGIPTYFVGNEMFFGKDRLDQVRSEEHTSELQSLMRISYAVFCLKRKKCLQDLLALRSTRQLQAEPYSQRNREARSTPCTRNAS